MFPSLVVFSSVLALGRETLTQAEHWHGYTLESAETATEMWGGEGGKWAKNAFWGM